MLLHSITDARDGYDGVGITGSHGGMYAGWVAHRSRLRGAIFNDAGGGYRVNGVPAGVAGVVALATAGMAAAAVTHVSAEIGDARETLGGTIGTVNVLARALGVRAGMTARQAAQLLERAERGEGAFPPVAEGASEWFGAALLDSASLVAPQHRGRIVITGSHGGLVGGDATRAIKVPVRLAVFNDAGVGRNGAGLARIRVLEERNIAAAAVAHTTAPIGEARPMLDGRLAFVNAPAAALGLAIGSTLRDALAPLMSDRS